MPELLVGGKSAGINIQAGKSDGRSHAPEWNDLDIKGAGGETQSVFSLIRG